MSIWRSVTSTNTLAALIIALNDPRFSLGSSRFDIGDLSAYVASRTLAHNKQALDLMSMFARVTPQRDWIDWTGGSAKKFKTKAELARPAFQGTENAPQISGALIQSKETAFAFTEEGLRLLSGQEFKQEVDSVFDGDKIRIIREMLYRLLTPTEENGFDHRFGGRAVKVLGLANGDAWKYPTGLYGNPISANHNHYRFQIGGALSATDLDNLVKDVREHGWPRVRIIINPDASGAFVGIPGYTEYKFEGTVPATTADHIGAIRKQEDFSSEGLVKVGRYKGIEVYSLWWWPVDYIICTPEESSEDKSRPLVIRVFSPEYTLASGLAEVGNIEVNGALRPGLGDLRMMRQDGRTIDDLFDISYFEREMGVGTGSRTAASVLYRGTGAYLIPDVTTLVGGY